MSSGFSGEDTSSTGKVCKFFQKKGNCKLGDNCKFLHCEEKNNHAILNKPKSSPNKKTNKKISFYVSGKETDKNEGLNNQLESFKKEGVKEENENGGEGQKINKPCFKFTKTGPCPFGDSCKYQHVV